MSEKIRADKWLKKRFPQLNGRHLEEAFELKLVSLEGKPLSKGDKIEAGSALEVSELQGELETIWAGNSDLDITVVAEESDFVVIDKPPGVSSQPIHLRDRDTVTSWALAQYSEVRYRFFEFQPELVAHRLDRGTSGVQIVTLSPAAHRYWREEFAQKKVEKTYLAWCWGTASRPTWRIDTPLLPQGPTKMRPASRRDEDGFQAESEVVIERQEKDRFLARVRCHSGVRHQVRAHLAIAGHPLLGDALYDAYQASRAWQGEYHLLRALELVTERGRFEVPSEDFRALF